MIEDRKVELVRRDCTDFGNKINRNGDDFLFLMQEYYVIVSVLGDTENCDDPSWGTAGGTRGLQ